MAFSHSRYIDASRSNFYDIGRDYNTNNIVHFDNRTVHLNLTLSGSEAIGHVLRDLNVSDRLPSSISGLDTLSQKKAVVPVCYSSTAASGVDAAAGLIVKIVQLLLNRGAFPETYRDLKHDLESLHQMLLLTGLAIQVYQYTSLGESLAKTISPEVEHCRVMLQEVLDDTQSCRLGLNPTSISGLWRQVWWRGWDATELASVRTKLSACQDTLGRFLIALNSYVLPFCCTIVKQ